MRSPFPLAIVIGAGIAYHVVQKAASAARPWRMLAIAYAAALTASLALALASKDAGATPPHRELGAALLLGLAIFGVEAGFFFVYRAGWPLASASVIASITVTAVLAVVGVIAFGDRLTATRAAGLVLTVVGAALVARGSR